MPANRKQIIKNAISKSTPKQFSKGPRYGGPKAGRPMTSAKVKRATKGLRYL